MATALITGISGFIGSNLARRLLAEGVTVRGIDDMSSGKAENLDEIRSMIDFREANVQDCKAVREACQGVDYVFHEAAIPSVVKTVDDPLGTNGPNLNGTLCLLEAARQAGVKRLIFAASSAVYGDALELPKRESMLPAPISPYAVQKLASEYYLASYTRVFGLETVALRYFNVFGPWQDPTSMYSGVLAIFISKMLSGEAPTIFGDGTTSRDFVYIDDVVKANLLACKAPSSAAGRVFNIAGGKKTTLLEAFQVIKEIIGFQGDVKFGPERVGDIQHSLADITQAGDALGYRASVDFRAGVERTISWYESR